MIEPTERESEPSPDARETKDARKAAYYPMGVEYPEWLGSGKETMSYQLAIFDDGSDDEMIHLTRTEYIWLKLQLATHRGYKVPNEFQKCMYR